MNLPVQYCPLALVCAKCGNYLTLSIELVEYLVETEKSILNDDADDFDDFDAAIQAALDGRHRKAGFHSPQAVFPLAIDRLDGSINFIGWCKKCAEPRLASTTLEELAQLVAQITGSQNPN